MEKRDLYQTVTDKIVVMLEAASLEGWQKPWLPATAGAGAPFNATTGAHYRGVNILTLWAEAAAGGRAAPAWASYKQWQAAGGQVRKGERGAMIVWAGKVTAKDAGDDAGDGEGEARRTFSVLRASFVFNIDQVDGAEAIKARLATPARPPEFARLEAAERMVTATRAEIRYGGDRAYYSPTLDYVGMPKPEQFTATRSSSAAECFYGTLFHELAHWTGHKGRLAREFGKRFGDDAYAAEELVAELGAAFLCAKVGISPEPRADHAAYLKSWLRVLKGDKRAIFTAASAASKAADYVAGASSASAAPPLALAA